MSDPTEVIEVTAPPEVVEVLDLVTEETVVVVEPVVEVVEVEGVIEILEAEPVTEVVETETNPTTVEINEVADPEIVEVKGYFVVQPQNTFIQSADPGNHVQPILWVKLNPNTPGDISLVLRVPG